jgi:hypothetical protein
MKVNFWVFLRNNDDGSASAVYFPTEELAEQYASWDDERFCDDVYEQTLEFDENGVLVPNPDDVYYAEHGDYPNYN